MGIELTSEEWTVISAKVRLAKMNGFSGFSGKFQNGKLVLMRVEIDVPNEQLNNLYKNNLTVIPGTSSISA
jgi:hypothetical protein